MCVCSIHTPRRTETEPKAPEDWQVKARTQKPVLMSIFSRDANAEPPADPLDSAKPFSVQEENAPPLRFPKEGPKSSSVQSSPKSQRGTPTPVQEENAPPPCFSREEPASLNIQSSSRSQRDTPNLLGLRAASFESLDLRELELLLLFCLFACLFVFANLSRKTFDIEIPLSSTVKDVT